MSKQRRLLKAATHCLAVVGIMAYLAMSVQAEVVIEYIGGDPEEAGWTLTARGECTASLVDDAGTPALCIVDPTASSGQIWSYSWSNALTTTQQNDMTDVGFSISATVRVEDMIADGFDEAYALAPGFMVSIQDLGIWYRFDLGQDANGDTTYALRGGFNLTNVVSGTISGNDYRTYEMRYDSNAGSADIFIDGVKVISDIASSTDRAAILGNRVCWGAEDSPGRGAGYWTNVAFEIAPATLQPATSISYAGGVDPTSLGWVLSSVDAAAFTVGAIDDNGTAAWQIRDPKASTAFNSGMVYYSAPIEDMDISGVVTEGCVVKATLRAEDAIADGFDEETGYTPAIQVALEDAQLWCLLGIGLDTNGDTTYSLTGGFPLGDELTGVIAGSGYHDYELRYDPTTDTFEFLVDGTSEVVGSAPHTTEEQAALLGDRIQWGSFDALGVGSGNWASVDFAVGLDNVTPAMAVSSTAVPEPSCIVLILAGIGVLAIRSRKFFKKELLGLAVIGLALGLACSLQAEVVISYDSDVTGGDPELQGWSFAGGSGGTSGSVVDDNGTQALYIVDPTTASGVIWNYNWNGSLTAQQLTDVTETGFSVSMTVRAEDMIADGFDEAYGLTPGIQIALKDLGVWYLLGVGQDAAGNTTYGLTGGGYPWNAYVEGTLSGNGYHTYELRYNTSIKSASLYVDGVEAIANYRCGNATQNNSICWGSTDSPGVGAGYWTDVSFETAPSTITPGTMPTAISHTGSTNPAGEGWILKKVSDARWTESTGVDDGGTAAWYVSDTTADPLSIQQAEYYEGAESIDLSGVATEGFGMTATLRADDSVANGFDERVALTPAIQIAIEDVQVWCLLGIGLDENGDTTYSLKGGYPYSAEMTGTITGSGYHDYELYYDPESDSIDFWVDGEVEVTDYIATTTEAQAAELGDLIQWGSFDALGVGGGYWADVAFEVGADIPETSTKIAGDANGDGKVDGSDVTILAGNWQVGVDGTVEATWEMGDFNGDKKVDGSDVTILAGNWQYGVTAAAAAVPEPTSLVLIAMGLVALGIDFARRR